MCKLLIALIRGYQLLLSPWLGSSCRFEPTCSAYAIESLQRYGALAGSCLTLRRLGRCGPWCAGGHDPVPDALPRPGRIFTTLTQRGSPPPASASSNRTTP